MHDVLLLTVGDDGLVMALVALGHLQGTTVILKTFCGDRDCLEVVEGDAERHVVEVARCALAVDGRDDVCEAGRLIVRIEGVQPLAATTLVHTEEFIDREVLAVLGVVERLAHHRTRVTEL